MTSNMLEILQNAWTERSTLEKRILEEPWYEKPWGHIDFSTENKHQPDWDMNDQGRSSEIIFTAIESAGVPLAYGGYGERRSVYQLSEHFRSASEPRSVHLGVDLWVPAGTPILCPWEGRVHSFRDNAGDLDYGPTVILEHETSGVVWHTLYGHLSRGSLAGLTEGLGIERGARLVEVGDCAENGGWVPHLHFQVILDIGEWSGDYPGVSTETESAELLSNCPDPTDLLAPNLGGGRVLP